MKNVEVRVLNLSKTLKLPEYATTGADAVDLMACFDSSDIKYYDTDNNEIIFKNRKLDSEFSLLPGFRALIPTGLKVALPEGYEAQVKPRSGLALKKGVTVLNSPGTVDADYRGEICVILFNTSNQVFKIHHRDRIAQLAIKHSKQLEWIPVTNEESLGDTDRGNGGFGHTGVK